MALKKSNRRGAGFKVRCFLPGGGQRYHPHGSDMPTAAFHADVVIRWRTLKATDGLVVPKVFHQGGKLGLVNAVLKILMDGNHDLR